MNINATLEKLNAMRLSGFEKAYREITENAQQDKFTTDELIAHLVDAEYDDKYNKKLSRLVKQARFKQQASLEQLNFLHPRGLIKNQVGGYFMFKLKYFFKLSNLLKTIAMLFTMAIIISLFTAYVYADAWNRANDPRLFQTDFTYSLNNLSFPIGP